MALIEDILPNLTPPGKEQEPLRKEEVAVYPSTPDNLAILKQVIQDLARAESWVMSRDILTDWDKCDRLFLFRVPIQYWEGTTVERAHLGMPVVLEHIESLLPQVMTGIFGDEPPFLFKPRPGTKMDAARANEAVLGWELNRADFKEQIRLLTKSTLQYGTGIGKWGWKTHTEKAIEMRRKAPEQFQPLAVGGMTMPQKGSDELEEVETDIEINQPTFEWVERRHILVDPGLRRSDIRNAHYVIHRIYVTLSQLNEWRDQEGYDIPEESKLLELFFEPKEPVQASTLESSSLDVNQDFRAEDRAKPTTIDPYRQPLEVIEYTNKDYIYAVLQRKVIIRKETNKWRKINYVSVPFIDVLGTFDGLGVAHVIGGEQRVQQGVMNAFLDDISLSLNGMFIRKRGSNVPSTQIRMRPGGVIDTDEEGGIGLLPRQPIPLEALSIIANSDSRAQRRTGANEIAVQGSMPSEKSSVTRTATGVNMLTAGVGSKLQYFVENLARQVFVPTLEAFHMMNRKNLKPAQLKAILSDELNMAYSGDVVDLLNVQGHYEILAGAHLQQKRTMTQVLPLLFQFVLTEPVMSALKEQGQKIDVGEMVKMLWQVSGWPNKQDVVVKFNLEEEQRAMLNNPVVQQALARQEQQKQAQGDKLEMLEEETIARSGRDVISSLLKQAEARALGKPEIARGGGG